MISSKFYRASSVRLPPRVETTELHSGWLKKQGGTFRTWRRRFFVLDGSGRLAYYTTEDKLHYSGFFSLAEGPITVSSYESETGNAAVDRTYNFSLKRSDASPSSVPENRQQIYLAASTARERTLWLRAIRRYLYLDKGGGLFGTHLSEVFIHTSPSTHFLPRVVFEAAEFIRKYGITADGIFRKCGTQHSIQELADAYDSAEPSPILKPGVHDAHSAAGLLKLYLRELPEPVIPFQFYDRLKATGYRIDDGQDLQPVISILETLPAPNYTLLQFLCQFLFEISEHSSENRMTVENLASVFAPNILRQAEEDPDIEMAASPILSVTIAGFIRAHRQLFLRDLISLAQFESAVLRTDKPSAAADKETTAPISSRGFVGSLKAKRKPRNRSKTMTLSRAQYGIVDGDSTHSTPERVRNTVSDRGQIWFPHERAELPANGRSCDGSNASSSLAICPSKDRPQEGSSRSTARGNGVYPAVVPPSNTAISVRSIATAAVTPTPTTSSATSPGGLQRFSSGEVASTPSRGSTGRISERPVGASDAHRQLRLRRSGGPLGGPQTTLSNSSSERGLSSCDSRNVSLSTNSAVFFPEEGESSPDGWYWHLGGRSSGITFFLELLSSSALTNKVRRISIRGTGLKRYFIVLYIFLETVSFS
uniref:Rho GTPase-activating protein 24 n=1 Tax=Schistocephalus solidus TaxID=70667 RepID=A0A0X3Q9S6_SCHSO